MRALYHFAFAKWPGEWITKEALFNAMEEADDEDIAWFGAWTGDEGKGTRNKCGMALKAYKNRVLGGIRLNIDENGKGARQKVRFSSEGGNLGNPGNLVTPEAKDKIIPDNEISPAFSLPVVDPPKEVSQVSKVSSAEYRLITDSGDFPGITNAISSAASVALDIETYGPGKGDALDPRKGRIRLLQLAIPGHVPWLIDLKATGVDLGSLKGALEASELIIHNARFDLGFLREHLGIVAPKVYCTLTASQLLTAGTGDRNDLFTCLKRHLGIPAYADESGSGWGGSLTCPQLAYATADVLHLHSLRKALDEQIDGADLRRVTNLEMELIPVVVAIEAAGLPVDREELDTQIGKVSQLAEQTRNVLRGRTDNLGFNPNSPSQVKAMFGQQGLALPDTAQETLAAFSTNELVALLLEYRHQSKLASLLEKLRKELDADGRLRSSFNPMGTCTGRFSSSGPNLQNIPRGDPRTIIKAPAGRRFVRADYSQIELRIAAAITSEQQMLQAFRNGEDLHYLTAAFVTGKEPSAITKQERQEAKAVNFGFIYGQGAEGFRKRAKAEYGLDLCLERAEELRRSFFKAYPALDAWHKDAWHKAKRGAKETRTREGRRRLIPRDASEWNRFTALVNTPVQGLGADGMKRALIRLHRELPKEASIILTVHDDVLVECPEMLADSVKILVERILIEEMSKLLPEVPIDVEAEILGEWQ